MGTILASAIITNTSLVLQDTTNVQWSTTEQLEWLNDGQDQIALAKPDVSSTIGNITCVAGSKQTVPATWNRLLEVHRNMGTGSTPGRAVTKVNRRTLDLQRPSWHTETPVDDALHYIFDSRTPRTFYLYPPVKAGRVLEASGVVAPARLATISDPISLDDMWAPVLHDYILYRAYTKDNGDGNIQRAALHLKAFSDAIGAKINSDATGDAQQQPALGS